MHKNVSVYKVYYAGIIALKYANITHELQQATKIRSSPTEGAIVKHRLFPGGSDISADYAYIMNGSTFKMSYIKMAFSPLLKEDWGTNQTDHFKSQSICTLIRKLEITREEPSV